MKGALIAGVLLASMVVAVLFFVLSKPDEKENFLDVSEPYRATLSGEYICLPHVDTTGSQTKECAFGIKTETGEYYAIDLSLMLEEHRPLSAGEQITANGLVTTLKRLSADVWQRYPIIGIFSVTDTLVTETEDIEPHVCSADVKICPDGSAVGRTGANCEFSDCPLPAVLSSSVTTSLGGSITALTVTVSPSEIISDSRCPSDVTCVWAGTVEVRTMLSTPVSHGEHVLKLGESQEFGDYRVKLIDVTPDKKQADIPESSYRFVFEIVKWN